MEKRDFRVPLFGGAPCMAKNNVLMFLCSQCVPTKKKHSPKIINKCLIFNCDPDRIQTCNLLIRSQMLYSVKLRGPVLWVQSYTIFTNQQKNPQINFSASTNLSPPTFRNRLIHKKVKYN